MKIKIFPIFFLKEYLDVLHRMIILMKIINFQYHNVKKK